MSIEANVTDYRLGEDRTFVFTIYEPGTTQAQIDAGTAQLQDITGWTFGWALKSRRWDPDLDAVVTKADGDLSKDTGASTVTLTVLRADTDALPPGTYFQSLARVDPGAYTVLAEGDFVADRAAL